MDWIQDDPGWASKVVIPAESFAAALSRGQMAPSWLGEGQGPKNDEKSWMSKE